METKNNINNNDLICSIEHNEKQVRFILELSDQLRTLSDPDKIYKTITKVTRKYYEADRCYYYEIQGDKAIIRQDVSIDDLPLTMNKDECDKYPKLKLQLEAGQPVVINNLEDTDILDENLRQSYIQIGARSFLTIPVIKKDKVTGVFIIAKYEPYKWTRGDISLARDIAERTWMAVEKAKAQEEKNYFWDRSLKSVKD